MPDGLLISCSLAFELVNLSGGWSGLGDEDWPPNTAGVKYRRKEVMMLRRTVSLSFAAVCVTAIATMPGHAQPAGTYGPAPGYNSPQSPATYGSPPGYNGPQGSAPYGSAPGYNAQQSNQGDVAPSASARGNVIESRQYDRALETNRGFRQTCMRKECGPITDPELRQSCLASFSQDEPRMGSSSGRSYR